MSARKVLMTNVTGGRVRGRSRLAWVDGVKVALGCRGMTVEAGRQCVKGRKDFDMYVDMYMIEINAAIFAWP